MSSKTNTSTCPEPLFPFLYTDDAKNDTAPAKPLLKTSSLKDLIVKMGEGNPFVDKLLPSLSNPFEANVRFPPDYFCALHELVNSAGAFYPAGTPNYLGARVPLQHTGLHLDKWRKHLLGYEHVELCQYLEFGFPLGLQQDPEPALRSSSRNHGSAYQYYTWIDKFVETGLYNCDLSGPMTAPPFNSFQTSPLMTAPKKPNGRRAVFDATFGESSLNLNTPSDHYMGLPIDYAYPRIEDFKRFIIKHGKGCFIYKRDLSRYFLQIPLDPKEYNRVGFVWRGSFFFFCGFMFGLKHAGFQGQRITSAVTWIHRRLGLETDHEEYYDSLNYSDDIGGCEATKDRAVAAYTSLGSLFSELGLRESKSKAHPPSTCMPYLGVEFDTQAMVMRIPSEKLEEVREELSLWVRKTTVSKRSLQKLLGRLFWVSRCIQYSRAFMSRLLNQLKSMHGLADHKKVKLSEDCREDIQWWARYVRRFNGTELIYPTDPLNLSLDQLLDTTAIVCCGDAQPMGGGAYCGGQYWSRPFPSWLQDPTIPIHLKEFWVVLASSWLWSSQWRGKLVYIFCDNTAVVEVLEKERPNDPKMQELLREFLYIVCTRGFTPVFRAIGTKSNKTADFISRVHNPDYTRDFFKKNSLPARNPVTAPDNLFTLKSNW